ncbi:hypothetical protein, partial [Rhizobium sp. BR 315]|uniref:hypothetical protein n=1 Tax=Rhizobium sp. BR 315 TaxID=3040014 RepID=UPI003D330AE9
HRGLSQSRPDAAEVLIASHSGHVSSRSDDCPRFGYGNCRQRQRFPGLVKEATEKSWNECSQPNRLVIAALRGLFSDGSGFAINTLRHPSNFARSFS